MFEGYKTYIFGGLLFISALLYGFGLINTKVFLTLAGIFSAGGMYGVRKGIKTDVVKAFAYLVELSQTHTKNKKKK